MPRQTDFETDVKTYGPIGEKRLWERLQNSPHTVRAYNVADNRHFDRYDVDLIQVFGNSSQTTPETVLDDLKRDKPQYRDYYTYEVKTDTFGLKSRNIVFEVMSNTKPGCLLRTRADYVFYVLIDEENRIKEEYLFDTLKLKRWILCNFGQVNRVPWLQSKYMEHGTDKTALLVINIERLLTDRITFKV